MSEYYGYPYYMDQDDDHEPKRKPKITPLQWIAFAVIASYFSYLIYTMI